MVIYGMSPSSGLERRLTVEGTEPGVSLRIYDHAEDVERARIVVSGDELLAAIISPAEAGSKIEGASLNLGAGTRLDVTVRRNEVQLKTSAEGGSEWDIAVGLDDFQDALEGVVGGE